MPDEQRLPQARFESNARLSIQNFVGKYMQRTKQKLKS